MAGSTSNPVVLDPLQTIVEVGWPSGDYVAFLTKIGLNAGAGSAGIFPGVCTEGIAIPPGVSTTNTYPTTTAYGYYDGTISWAGQSTTSASKWDHVARAWGGVPLTVTGMPSFPGTDTTGGFGDLTQSFSGAVGDPAGDDSFPIRGVYSILGSTLDIPIPVDSGTFFRSGAPTIEIYGASFNGSPNCYDIGGASFERRAPYDAAYSIVSTIAFPITNIVARLADGKAYRAIGAAKVAGNFDGGVGTLRGIHMTVPGDSNYADLWILCRRSKADDLS